MENERHTEHWFDLYEEAIFETDAEKLGIRISKAQNAIKVRAKQLWYEGSQEATERERLETAYHFLEILRSLSEKGRQP